MIFFTDHPAKKMDFLGKKKRNRSRQHWNDRIRISNTCNQMRIMFFRIKLNLPGLLVLRNQPSKFDSQWLKYMRKDWRKMWRVFICIYAKMQKSETKLSILQAMTTVALTFAAPVISFGERLAFFRWRER